MRHKHLLRKQILSIFLAVSMILSLIPMTAMAAVESISYIALTSDVHGSDTNLQTWLTSLKNNGTTSLDYFIFAGDYPTWNYETDAATNATRYRGFVQDAFDDVPVALTRGNHDTSGDYGAPYDQGSQYNGSDFAVYVMPAYELDGVSSGVYGGQGFTKEAMGDLDLFLSGIDLSKPVFVASHFPIHHFSSRTSKNASEMIDLLNQYPNVIFVYGHNHTLNDTNYKSIKTAGDSIQYTGNSTKTINFTYSACGGMMDGAGQDIRGLLVTLTDTGDKTTINFQHQNISGEEKTKKTITLDSPGGTTTPQDPDPNTGDYVLANNIEEGGQYLIVAKSGSNYYALTTDTAQSDFLAAQQVTVSGNTIDAGSVNAAKMVWTFTADGDGYDVMNGGKYLNRDTGSGGGNHEGLFVSTSESGASYSDWIYNNNNLYVYSTSGDTNFNMILGSGNGYFQASYKDSQEIYLYKLTSNGTTPPGPDPDPNTGDYVLATNIDEGGQYVIVAESSGEHYALTSTKSGNYLAGGSVTVSGDTLVSSTVNAETMLWTFAADGEGYNVMNDGKFLARISGSSNSLSLSSTDTGSTYTDWIYNETSLYVRGHSNYNLRYSSSNSAFQASTSSGSVQLYKLTSNGTTPPQDPDPDTGDYVLANNIEEGGQYVIVAESSGKHYALTATKSGNYLAGDGVTVSGDTLVGSTVNAETMLWTFTADGEGYNVMNDGKFLARVSGSDNGLNLSSTDTGPTYTDWIYDGTSLYVVRSGHSNYNLRYSSSNSAFQASTSSGSVNLYKLISGGTTPPPDPDPGTGDYVLANNIEEGGQYLIVAKSGSNYYALTTDVEQDKYLAGQQVTVIDNAVVSDSVNAAKMLWTFTADGDGFNVMNGANYLNRSAYDDYGYSDGLIVNPTEADAPYSDWIYSDSKFYTYSINGETEFYLVFDSNIFSADYENSQEIYLFKLSDSAPVILSHISVSFDQGEDVIYPTSNLDSLKPHLIVTATYSDGSSSEITGYILSGALTVGTSIVTVDYEGKTATFNVTVTEETVPVVLDSIAVTTPPTKTTYTKGEALSLVGMMVTAYYSDGSEKTVEGYTADPDSSTVLDTVGTQSITVSYTEDSVTKMNVTNVIVNDETITQHTVNFDADNDTPMANVTVAHGAFVTRPADPEKSGYTFLGWFLDDELFDFDTPITDTITLFAHWTETITEYIVTFDADNDTPMANVTVAHGAFVTRPADPEKSGCTFLGWFLDDELFDFGTPITDTITLFAHWTEIITEYTVTFDADNGTQPQVKTILKGGSAIKPADPVKEGFIFSGWYKGDLLYNFNSAVNENLTLKAKWTEIAEGTIISIPTIESSRGRIIEVPIHIEQNPGIVTVQMVIEYDPSILTPIGLSNGSVWRDPLTYNLEYSSNEVFFGGPSTSLMTGDGELAVIRFKIKEDAIYGEYPLKIDVQELNTLYGSDQHGVPLTKSDGKLKVLAYKIGDINNDGVITSADATEILLYVAQMKEFTDLQLLAADVNGDGKVTSADATEILLIAARLKDPPAASAAMQIMGLAVLKSTDGETPVKLEIGSTVGKEGEYVTLPIRISENTGLSTFTFHIGYNSSKLKPVSADLEKDWGATIICNLNAVDLTTKEPIIILTSAKSDNWDNNGTIAEILFEVLDNGMSGETTVNLNVYDLCYVDSGHQVQNLSHEITYGKVEIQTSGSTHSYISKVTEPTCEARGYTTYTCSVCGHFYFDNYTDAIGHDWGEWFVKTAATCKAVGVESRVCANNADHIETRTIEALGHSWDSGVITTKPTYSIEGVRTYTCTLCGENKTESIPRLTSSGSGSNSSKSGSSSSSSSSSNNGSSSGSGSTQIDEVVEIDEDEIPLSNTPAINPFIDVLSDAWYYDDVMLAYANGLMNGTATDRFSPGSKLTRAMIVTILWRLEGTPGAEDAICSNFADVVQGSYYELAVGWAAKNEIIFGYSEEHFGPNDDITREQLVTILWRYAKYKGMDIISGEEADILSYNDASNISKYAIPAMQWAFIEKIITGKPGEFLDPQGGATRAETAAMLNRFQSMME